MHDTIIVEACGDHLFFPSAHTQAHSCRHADLKQTFICELTADEMQDEFGNPIGGKKRRKRTGGGVSPDGFR